MSIKTLCLIFFIAFIKTIVAQNGSIKGTIIDNQTLNPIEYASIAIINPSNQLDVAGALSTKTGNFSIKNIKRGT
jgi:hypothetical protein